MEQQKKEAYAEPVLVAHELLRDVTGGASNHQCQKFLDNTCVD